MVSEITMPSAVSRPQYDIEARVTGHAWVRRTLGHLPTAHIAGVQGYFINVFYEGGTVYWMPRFDLEAFLKYVEALEINFFFTVPPIYMAIAKHPLVKNQFRHMRQAVSGAAPLSGELQKAANAKLPAGTEISQVWGLSETTGAATYFPTGWPVTPGSLGIPLPNCKIR
jgi:4-coumarate--CoA ligase